MLTILSLVLLSVVTNVDRNGRFVDRNGHLLRVELLYKYFSFAARLFIHDTHQ